ncbi:protein flightless-1-like protein [Dinothrombium tinctorium]|uniref:Protein flightless-1-like protein n=1 Tax=Dinothrombium tinctorium TaxID=1965070 RepID=A0A3S3PKQ5_9ACAR|nr:protein flightless-1-like protein [Dinothrombium tinctorium]
MLSTGVLPFVRGIDFSRNNFEHEDNFPKSVSQMTGLRWLKLNQTHIDWVPEQLANLNKLESLSFVRNNLMTLHGEIAAMPSLRYLNCRYNCLKNSGIPPQLFKLDELLILDLSHNQLKEVPSELEQAKSLRVLNLSNNEIESIPNHLFVHLTDLLYLDLSNNKLDTLPPQLRRLVNLQTLILNSNNLSHNQLRQLPSLVSLQTLHLRNTERNLQNLPTSLDSLTFLNDVDLAMNELSQVPECLFTLPNLRRLNLSDNKLTEIPNSIDEAWKNLESLNLSRNKLKSLPSELCKLSKLRRLYISYNNIDFDGIPSGIGKLCNLEVFVASNNNLEMIPEGVVRCGRLKKLVLSHNRLITLPDAIHLLNDLEVLDLADNPDLIMPPKPPEYQQTKGSGMEFYNIDFSLNTQLRKAGASAAHVAAQNVSTPSKDPIARKMRLRRRHRENSEDDGTNQAKVLKGMSELAKDKNIKMFDNLDNTEENLKPKRWDEVLEKPALDYSDFFDDDVGQTVGLTIWEIEKFLPNQVDEALHGKFYEGDCYIILKTFLDENQSLNWEIFYWIGAQTSLDKKACSAIHAVHLRNYLGAQCRTIREEQAQESDEFLSLFPDGIVYVEGGRTASGFFTVEEVEVTHRLYRLHELSDKHRQLYMETVPCSKDSLDPRCVFILDAGNIIYVWYGKRSKNTMKQKARLLAEKINKDERKNKSEIIFFPQENEAQEFLDLIGADPDNYEIKEHIDFENYRPLHPILYQVCLGMGYLELPQVEFSEGKLKPSLLDPKNVYILDCSTDLFVWLGRKSARLVKAAALKLAQELYNMIKRPDYALVIRCLQGTEPQIFKTKFCAWDDVIAVDFTRTADSVARTGANLSEWMAKQEVKIDIAALFTPRQPIMSDEEANQLMEEWNEDLEALEAFVLEGKKFVRLPEEELGNFYSEDCYVFLCRYWVPLQTEGSDDGEEVEDDFQCVVYFWQGRDASNMGWLTFTFSLQKKFQSLFGDKLEVVRTHQQQENLKFLSHFKQKFIIHQGKRNADRENDVEFFYIRSNCSPITTRCIQIKPDPGVINSGFCYILRLPEDNDYSEIVFVWIGSKAHPSEAKLAEEIALKLYPTESCMITIINEEEDDGNGRFWQALGGKRDYEKNADFMNYTRLFRCSNDKGYFSISEKCPDFCQDDLADDDIMILDNGSQVFIWVGSKCSDVEVKLAYKSAQVYLQNLRIKQPDRPRQLMLTFKGKESKRFTKCFHGWSKHKIVSDPRETYLALNEIS